MNNKLFRVMQNDKKDPCSPYDLSFYVVGSNVFFGLLLVDCDGCVSVLHGNQCQCYNKTIQSNGFQIDQCHTKMKIRFGECLL